MAKKKQRKAEQPQTTDLKPFDEVQWIPETPVFIKEFDNKSQRSGYQNEMFSLPEVWELGVKGQGVKAGVADTGCSKFHRQPDGDLRNVSYVGSSVPREPSGDDRNGHGSHCLGIIGMADDNNGAVGVAPDCELLSEQVLSSRGGGQSNWIAAGIRNLVDQGVQVINLSIGSAGFSREIFDACEYAYRKDVIVFAANGNDGRNNDVDYPGANENTIAVAACDNELKRASFSDAGKQTDAIAPGVRVFSCTVGRWGEMSGTSMATPLKPGWQYWPFVRRSSSPESV